MNLVLDTETSGLFDFSKPADADGQPRLASFACIFVTPELALEGEHHWLIKPDGWTLSEEAARVNGLTMERLHAEGQPIKNVLEFYAAGIDSGRIVIAFNAQFDTKVMRAELRRAGMDDRFAKTPNICVMRGSVNVCKVPKKSGGGYKLPKLEEAMRHFGLALPDQHTALGDARAALDIARVLRNMGCLPLPEVHYAKQRPGDPPTPTP